VHAEHELQLPFPSHMPPSHLADAGFAVNWHAPAFVQTGSSTHALVDGVHSVADRHCTQAPASLQTPPSHELPVGVV
jgi:hypothetical protein